MSTIQGLDKMNQQEQRNLVGYRIIRKKFAHTDFTFILNWIYISLAFFITHQIVLKTNKSKLPCQILCHISFVWGSNKSQMSAVDSSRHLSQYFGGLGWGHRKLGREMPNQETIFKVDSISMYISQRARLSKKVKSLSNRKLMFSLFNQSCSQLKRNNINKLTRQIKSKLAHF